MQYLCAAGRDLLRFVVMQSADQARGRRGARIRAEHAGHVGPDLDLLRAQLGTEIRGRRVRTTTTQQAGVALAVAADESLRDDDWRRRIELRFQSGIRRETTR